MTIIFWRRDHQNAVVRNFLQAQMRDRKKPGAHPYWSDSHVKWNAYRVLYGRLSLLKG
jgi:hypothetical protein